ncbi:DUF4437 domain-containing protein [Corallincola platygyrae]|uniref:DUF4437 domain-containing protein n=1 Tax=Corallincola platygyrae TaxID=1193278 RepID=A0ABW4XNK4_9GAMM
MPYLLRHTVLPLVAVLAITGCNATSAPIEKSSSATETRYEMVLKSEVNWEHLNPARGDKSPSAGTLWGDRNGRQATGYLLKPTDGFSSPPHIHNVSYRGVVISGLIHNDDPDAAKMWMPAGSFWTQPKGEVHVTAAKGDNTLAYIEIEEGPYLVWPAIQAFDNGERPVNVDQSNIVWLDGSTINWLPHNDSENKLEIAYLWGEPNGDQHYGALIKLPAGFNGKLVSEGESLRAIVIKGQPEYQSPDQQQSNNLTPGSYFGADGSSEHKISSNSTTETILYLRTNKMLRIE